TWIVSSSRSRRPLMSSRSSSDSFTHFYFISLLNCFQFCWMEDQSIVSSLCVAITAHWNKWTQDYRVSPHGDRPSLRSTQTGGRPPGSINVPIPLGGRYDNMPKLGKIRSLPI